VWGREGGRGREEGEYMGVWVGRLHIYIYMCGPVAVCPSPLSSSPST